MPLPDRLPNRTPLIAGRPVATRFTGTGRSTERLPRVLSIRWIVTFTAVALTATAVLSIGTLAERRTRAALTREIQSRLVFQTRNLAETSSKLLLGEFPEMTLYPMLKEMVAREREIAFALVVDRNGRVQGHPDFRRIGSPYVEPEGLVVVADAPAVWPGVSLRSNAALLVATVPIVHATGGMLGKAVVALPRAYIDRQLATVRSEQFIVLIGFLVLGTVLAFLVMSGLLRPVGALRDGIERIARGDLETPIRVRDRTELGLLATAINDMTRALKRAQVELIERERLAHEVDLARQIQQSLLPSRPVHESGFTIQGYQRAASEVGGDYYDVLTLPDGRIGVTIADVSGKGLAGCLVMTMLSALLRALRTSHDSPARLLGVLDERLGESLAPGMFVTMFYGVLDPTTGVLVYASAGHNPMLVYRKATGHIERREAKGIPIGAIRGGAIRSTLADEQVRLEPGDLLVQYTDGVTEAFDAVGAQLFGEERLMEVVNRTAAQGPVALLDASRQAIVTWSGGNPPSDDETLLVVSHDGAAPAVATPRSNTAPAPAVAAGPSNIETADTVEVALELLERARRGGRRLMLEPGQDCLAGLRDWMVYLEPFRTLDGPNRELVCTALYEVCQNISEHGVRGDGAPAYEVWWVPPSPAGPAALSADARAPEDPHVAVALLRNGWFVVRDEGRPFAPANWRATDFADRSVWNRRRGFGLDIIHRVMREASYHPSTAQGNVTVLRYGPRSPATCSTGDPPGEPHERAA